MTDLDRFAREVASANEAPLGNALRTLLKLRDVAPELFAVVRAVRAVRREDGRLACTMCKAAWLMPSMEIHTPECPLSTLKAKLASWGAAHAIENAYLFNKVHPEGAFQKLPHDHPAVGDKTEDDDG